MAETVVPRLADGTVDVGAVMSSFHATSPVTTDGALEVFEGTLLGYDFAASVSEGANGGSILTVEASQLSEGATYIAAVLLADLVCMMRDLRPAPLKWKETAAKVDGGWQVNLDCLSATEAAKG